MAVTSGHNNGKKSGAVVLGRSAATGRLVMAPVTSKKVIVSDRKIDAAVKSALSKSG